jgi:hypothetical protein
MKRQSASELKREMERLMEEHLESLRKQAFMAPTQKEREQDEDRLALIREMSADYLATIQSSHAEIGGESMTEKPRVTLPGKVEKVIEPVNGEPEKAQIVTEGADPLGQEVVLKEDDQVDVTVEADPAAAEK